MKIYLHIGTEKTGTTSIQKFMNLNRSTLKSQGILYPRALGFANHIGMAALAQSRDRGALLARIGIESADDQLNYSNRAARRLRQELDGGRYNTVVISNEHCSSRLDSDVEIGKVRDFLSAFSDQISVIVYIRRQDELLVSGYSTGVKSGSPSELKLPLPRQIESRFNYWELLSRWARVFGRENIVCRKFERASFVSGNLIDDFLTAIGSNNDTSWKHSQVANTSLDARALEFLRLMNLHLGPDRRPRRLLPSLVDISRGPFIDLPDDDRRLLMEVVRDSNRQVADEYFPGIYPPSDDPLFAPSEDLRERTIPVRLETHDILGIVSELLGKGGRIEITGRKKSRLRPLGRRRDAGTRRRN